MPVLLLGRCENESTSVVVLVYGVGLFKLLLHRLWAKHNHLIKASFSINVLSYNSTTISLPFSFPIFLKLAPFLALGFTEAVTETFGITVPEKTHEAN